MAPGFIEELQNGYSRARMCSFVFGTIAVLEALFIVFAATALFFGYRTNDIMRENMELQSELRDMEAEYHEQTRRLCAVRLRIGEGYRRAMLSLIKRFGLEKQKPKTVTNVLLKEFENLDVGVGGGP